MNDVAIPGPIQIMHRFTVNVDPATVVDGWIQIGLVELEILGANGQWVRWALPVRRAFARGDRNLVRVSRPLLVTPAGGQPNGNDVIFAACDKWEDELRANESLWWKQWDAVRVDVEGRQ